LKRECAAAEDVEHDPSHPTPERKVESAAALPPAIATPLSVGHSGAASAGATAAIGEMGHSSTLSYDAATDVARVIASLPSADRTLNFPSNGGDSISGNGTRASSSTKRKTSSSTTATYCVGDAAAARTPSTKRHAHIQQCKHDRASSFRLCTRWEWICDSCESEFRDAASFSCEVCDFDICESCFGRLCSRTRRGTGADDRKSAAVAVNNETWKMTSVG